MSIPRYTWRESALTTSSGSLRARATAAAVLPTPVGPATTSRGRRRVMTPSLRLPVTLELPADVLHRHPADDGPAVRAEVRRVGHRQVGHEALHLLARQRRGRLDGGAAGHECERAIEGRLAGLGAPQLVHRCLEE